MVPPSPELYAHHATVLPVRDLATAVAFYRDRLGFEVGFEWGEPPTYAILRAAETSIHLSRIDPPGDGEEPRPIHPTLLYLFTHDVDALHDAVRDAGAEIAFPLQDLEYGMREFEVHDPDGHRLCFGMGIADD